MVNREYTIVFKNGGMEVIEQAATIEVHNEIMNTVNLCMQHGEEGVIRFGNGEDNGTLIRVSDITRIRFENIEAEVLN